MKKKMLTAVLGGTAVATLAFASASALTVNGGTIQVGADGVTCDTDGVKVNWGLETDDSSVRSVRVEGIDAACVGADMFIKTNLMSSAKKVAITGPEARLSFTPPYPSAEAITDVRIWIEG